MAKNIKAQEPTVSPRLNMHNIKPVSILDLTTKQVDAMKQNPEYANQPELQAAVAAWLDDANAIAQDETAADAARKVVRTRVGSRIKRVKKWKRTTKRVISLVNDLAQNDPALVKAWGFDTSIRTPSPVTEAAPEGLRVSYSKNLVMTIHWKAILGHRGYLVQIGDQAGQNWGPTLTAPNAKLIPVGLTPGQHITIRVAVQRKSGVSSWSDILSVVVR